jgi:RNA polymerase sigma-70 factor (ECF subfamily)
MNTNQQTNPKKIFLKTGNLFYFFRLMDRGITIDDKFIAKLKKGDVESFHELYIAIAPQMRMVCRRYVRNEADAEDVFHEGFLKVYKHIGTLKNSGSFWGWLKRIFINTALDHYRLTKDNKNESIDGINESKFSIQDEDNEEFVAIDLVNKKVDYETIRKVDFSQEEMLDALQNIPEHFRVVFQLFVIDEYKHQEIAEMLSINEKTSKTRLLRARGLVKGELYKLAIQKVNNGQPG